MLLDRVLGREKTSRDYSKVGSSAATAAIFVLRQPEHYQYQPICFDMFIDPDKLCVAYGMSLISNTEGEIL